MSMRLRRLSKYKVELFFVCLFLFISEVEVVRLLVLLITVNRHLLYVLKLTDFTH